MALFESRLERIILITCFSTIGYLVYERTSINTNHHRPFVSPSDNTKYEHLSGIDDERRLSLDSDVIAEQQRCENAFSEANEPQVESVGVFNNKFEAEVDTKTLINQNLTRLKSLLGLDDAEFDSLRGLISANVNKQQNIKQIKNKLFKDFGHDLPQEELITLQEDALYNHREFEDSLRNFLSTDKQSLLKRQEIEAVRKYRSVSFESIVNYASDYLPSFSEIQKSQINNLIETLSHKKASEYPLGITLLQENSSPEALNLPDDEIVYREMKQQLRHILTQEQAELFDQIKYVNE